MPKENAKIKTLHSHNQIVDLTLTEENSK